MAPDPIQLLFPIATGCSLGSCFPIGKSRFS
ncbi:uncharacterized protein METZ01_LOCUS342522 [marine metagenome]|uniref:Uncharacterized protein n=1 Tax=marine metagenome TaxID=408172 RepID=A0A382QXU6_9ZZZZ